jgi:lia operon protein LiaG
MKIKKHAFALGLGLLSIVFVTAQEYKVPVQNTKEGKLTLIEFPGDLPIEGYSGNEIILVGTNKKADNPSRAKGLKAVYPGGEDNTGLAVFMEKNGNQVTLRCLLPITQGGSYKVRVPDNFMLDVQNECAKGGKVEVSNIKNEIEIQNCHDVSLKNVSGPVVVSTISGDVDVVFTELNKDKSLSLASVSGEIDITLPAKIGVNVEMRTISGSIYTDFELPAEKGTLRKIASGSIKAPLNGGGVDLKLTNVSGNIYLRKGQ